MEAKMRMFRKDIDTCLNYIKILEDELDRLRSKIQDPQVTIILQSDVFDVDASKIDLIMNRLNFQFRTSRALFDIINPDFEAVVG